ncbi:NAD(P)-binding protein [Hygrophoropsis aurantiaca]|uniref:NAD(P)-binding protein n=1 Tax=Hygrophoropsis aurantiaca TaxID=72124 RepID=A0ACB8A5W7_9AGAM|nr:NAD(P)-binding protein [Hygrophoropsis aurantiaca]
MAAVAKGIALVTGAAQGIGRAIALRLASDGFDVAVNDIPSKKSSLDEVVQAISDKGRKSLAICADVGDDGEVKGMIDSVVRELGGLDVMVANAGIGGFCPLIATSTDQFDLMFRIHARGTYLCYKYAALQMISQGRGGRIVGASSMAGKQGIAGLGLYSAAKFAIRGLTQTAALELGSHGITVNCYAPGIINTPIWNDASQSEISAASKAYMDKHIRASPAGYIGQPEDVASIVSYLASKEAHFITGRTPSKWTRSGVIVSNKAELFQNVYASSLFLKTPTIMPTQTPSLSKGVALVTGAAQGIGRAIALRLGDDGFDVALNDIPAKKLQLEEVARRLNVIGRRALSVYADVRVEMQVKEMIANVVTEFGGIDVMVANAGISCPDGSVLSTSAEEWDATFAVNARGVFLCYKYAALQMVAQGRGGRIIGASSSWGKRGAAHAADYSASKFAVRGLTQSAALELGPHKITVNSYAPGPIDTPMMQAQKNPGDKENEYAKKVVATTALGYLGQSEDVAALVSFLASKESHFVTGQCIAADGGATMS